VVARVSPRFVDSIIGLFKRDNKSRGVCITTVNDRIYINLYVTLKFGPPLQAVAESLRNTVKYGIEEFTGMVVSKVNINVIGVKL